MDQKIYFRNILRRYPLSCLLVAGIWVVCMIPVPETPLDDISFMDKWTHFVMYGTLTVVIWFEYLRCHRGGLLRWRRLLTGGVLLPIVMGGLVELAQAYLTTCRSGDVLDFACNSLGVMLGMMLGIMASRLINNN